MPRLALLAPVLTLVAVLLAADPTLSALCLGTNGPDTLIEKPSEGTDTLTGLSAAITASVGAVSGTQAELAAAADRLAEEARAQLAQMPEPGTLPRRRV